MLVATYAAASSGMKGSDAWTLVLAIIFVGWLFSSNKKKDGQSKRRTRPPVPKRRKVTAKSNGKRRKKFGS